MKNYRISQIHFHEEIGLGEACQQDNELLRFVFDCIAKTAAGESGDISLEEALQRLSMNKDDVDDVIPTAWTLPTPFITIHNERVTWVFVWLYIESRIVSFGLH